MSGGPASLRTAAITLGLALAIVGASSLLNGTFSQLGNSSSTAPNRSSRVAASLVDLGVPEADPSPPSSRRLRTSPTQLLTQIEADDLPPPPVPNALDVTPPTRAPAAELTDVEPVTPMPASPAAPVAAVCCERQEEQLARIALGIELLSRQSMQTVIERAAAEPPAVATETFSSPPEREATAIIKLERTAEDRDRFSLEVHHAPLRDVFGLLCDLAGLKLEMAPAVTGRVTITLRDLTLGEAINAVLEQADLGVERDEHRLRIMPRTMAEDRAIRKQPLVTKIYRPQLVRMADVLPLIRPVLTPRIGRLAVIPDPAGKLCPDIDTPYPSLPADILVVIDRAEVQDAVVKLLKELDVRDAAPMQ